MSNLEIIKNELKNQRIKSKEDKKNHWPIIRLNGACGFGNAGKKVYLVNTRYDRCIIATVRVKWIKGINKGQYDKVLKVHAGKERLLGCTLGGTVISKAYSYEVISCELL